MMTAVLNPSRNDTDTQIRVARTCTLHAHTHTNWQKMIRLYNIESGDKLESSSELSIWTRRGEYLWRVGECRGVRATGDGRQSCGYNRGTLDCTSGARVSVGAQRLAQARHGAAKRAGERFHRADIATAARRSTPAHMYSYDKARARRRVERGGRAMPALHAPNRLSYSASYLFAHTFAFYANYMANQLSSAMALLHVYSIHLINNTIL